MLYALSENSKQESREFLASSIYTVVALSPITTLKNQNNPDVRALRENAISYMRQALLIENINPEM